MKHTIHKCLEQPKMQNKHQKKFVVGVPTSREGGVKPVGTKSQVCQRKYFWGSPNNALQIFQKFKKKKNVFHNHNRRTAGSQDPRSRTFFGQNQEISSKIRKFHAKLGDFRQNQEILAKIGKFQPKLRNFRQNQEILGITPLSTQISASKFQNLSQIPLKHERKGNFQGSRQPLLIKSVCVNHKYPSVQIRPLH